MQTSVDIERILEAQTLVRRGEKRSSLSAIMQKLLLRRISARGKAEFCTQLAVMLQSRVSLHRALQVLTHQAKNQRMKQVIEMLDKEIQKGNSFASALSMQPDVFDNLFAVSAEVGQESGRLAEVLSHLALYLEKLAGLRRKFTQALTYPALVVTVACGAVAFLLVFIVPAFAEMFKSFQVELPTSTQFVLNLSVWAVDYGQYLIGLLLVGVLLSKRLYRAPSIRRRAERYSFKLPFLGDIILKNHVARVCRTLGTLLQAEVSLVDALVVTQKIVSTAGIHEEIGQILKHVKQGRTVAEPLIDSRLFPPMVAQMIAVGEETSELDAMLLKVAEYYEKELDMKIEILSSVLEPVIILFLGLIVAGILISMYLPMFDLVNVVSGD